MATPFSIYQDSWHDCWVAATMAARVRKMHIDLNIQQRVARLLEEYGPHSSMPLTLRVYGTMLKGFCVINNERLRVLCLDCERLVLAFDQSLAGEGGQAARPLPTKRKASEALTLDLDVSKLQEAEAFDWTQATLEDGALLRLAPPPEPTGLETFDQPPPLLSQVDLLDESFPAVDMPMMEPLALNGPAAPEAVAAAPPSPGGADDALPIADEAAPLALPPPAESAAADPAVLSVVLPTSRGTKRPFRTLDPGRVHGFDEDIVMAADAYDEWLRDAASISNRHLSARIQGMYVEQADIERSGILRLLIDHVGVAQVPRSISSLADTLPQGLGLPTGRDIVVPCLLGGPSQQPGNPAGAQQQQQSRAMIADAAPGIIAVDACGAHVLEDRLVSARGADVAIVGALHAKPSQADGAGKKFGEAAAPLYDEQTAQVAGVIFRHVEESSGEARGLTFDDLLPPSVTDKATAARTFLAVLMIGTAGELRVKQEEAYGPIVIAAKQTTS